MVTTTKKKGGGRRAEGGRKPKRPELNGVGRYVTGVRRITVAKVGLVRAVVELVEDRDGWHYGYRLDAPGDNTGGAPTENQLSNSRREAMIRACCSIEEALRRRARRPGASSDVTTALERVSDEIQRLRLGKKRIAPPAGRNGKKRSPGPRPQVPGPSRRPGATGKNGEVAGTGMVGRGPQSIATGSLVLRQDGPHGAPGKEWRDALDPQKLPMTPDDAETLHACEDVIRRALYSFADAGRALGTIQERRLWRGKYPSFEEYLAGEWGIGKAYAYRLISGAAVVERIENSPIGENGKTAKRSDIPAGHLVLPATESQVRPLTRLSDPKQQLQAWRKVLKVAPRGANNEPRVTAAIVEKVVAEVRGEPDRPARKPAANGHAQEPHAETRKRGETQGDMTVGEFMAFTDRLSLDVQDFAARCTPEARRDLVRFLGGLIREIGA